MKTSETQNGAATIDPGALLDVRPLAGRIKHATIFQRWFDLPPGGWFVLVNDHDPIPLKYQFDAEYAGAFRWDYLERGPEEFRVKITKLRAIAAAPSPAPAAPAKRAAAAGTGAPTSQREVDVRGLEPPEPLIRILEALETLPAGISLRAHTDREPCHLFGEAERRGFGYVCNEQSDGSWITVLTRK